MENKKITRENVTRHLLEEQLTIVGQTIDALFNDDRWRFNNTLTRDQHEEFKKNSIKTLQKVFKCNKSKAETAFGFFEERFGLRIKG